MLTERRKSRRPRTFRCAATLRYYVDVFPENLEEAAEMLA